MPSATAAVSLISGSCRQRSGGSPSRRAGRRRARPPTDLRQCDHAAREDVVVGPAPGVPAGEPARPRRTCSRVGFRLAPSGLPCPRNQPSPVVGGAPNGRASAARGGDPVEVPPQAPGREVGARIPGGRGPRSSAARRDRSRSGGAAGSSPRGPESTGRRRGTSSAGTGPRGVDRSACPSGTGTGTGGGGLNPP